MPLPLTSLVRAAATTCNLNSGLLGSLVPDSKCRQHQLVLAILLIHASTVLTIAFLEI